MRSRPLLLDSFTKIYQDEKRKPPTSPNLRQGFVSQIVGDSKYAVKDVTGRVISYGVRGPKGINKGGAVNISGGGDFSSISSLPNYSAIPEITTVEIDVFND